MEKYALIIEELTKRFGKVLALKGISFKASVGEIVGLLGPNGAGKTTTLKAIAGALKPTSGRVYVFGYDSFREQVKVRNLIGVVPELPGLSPELSVYDNLFFVGRIYGMKKHVVMDRIKELSEMLELKDLLRIKYAKLSKGLKRRVDIAAALIHDPKLLLLDEPTTGLDVISASALREYIVKLPREGKTIILSSHYIDEVMNIAHKVILLVKGTKLVEGSPLELKRILKLDKHVKIILDKPIDSSVFDIIAKHIETKSIGYDLRFRHNIVEMRSSNVVKTINEVSDLIRKAGHEIVDIEVVPPSWSDVFKKYIEGFSAKNCEACPLYRGGCIG
ncbi:ABC transporter ATP-binding protein [Staphylothermus hellenicus]|uniref:ABC transporter related protein n=1 Tax=Staphylothermus hellenicus (strain DSM 12710 / JCM 10830 / BK20S6-10-b1 / P8) TaxID=591019 RepID=D7DBN6_STAHD|nr:ABC transporter ATP-binding protein [Staphylothermus hellenicus]ADI31583.1 ABC transporter related protein [Staphylothermus hellenicus DSM 12710]